MLSRNKSTVKEKLAELDHKRNDSTDKLNNDICAAIQHVTTNTLPDVKKKIEKKIEILKLKSFPEILLSSANLGSEMTAFSPFRALEKIYSIFKGPLGTSNLKRGKSNFRTRYSLMIEKN